MFDSLRQKMVQKYIIDAGITDEGIVQAMLKVPRHLFVEPALAHQGYEAGSLPIGFGQTISHPTTVAVMTQALELTGNEKILEVGCGSGYQAAVLCEMGIKVFSIERIPALADRARELLEKLGYYSVAVRTGDGTLGWNEHAPYQAILVAALAPQIPDSLLNQLDEGGRLVIPVGKYSDQKLKIITRRKGNSEIVEKNWRSFVPLVGQKGWIE